jgi:hypothetical protein
MKLTAFVVCALVGLVLAIPAGAAAAHGTKVVCISQKTGKRVYQKKPERCTFHKHGEPMAEAFFVRTHDDHWRKWGRAHARGHGKERSPMGNSTTRVRIRLSHPVRRCGHRVFSRAHFFFPKTNHGSTMRLDTCA